LIATACATGAAAAVAVDTLGVKGLNVSAM